MSCLQSPLDRFGFSKNCCFCVPLRAAAMIICFATFVWMGCELYTTQQNLVKEIDDKHLLYYIKIVLNMAATGMMIASGILLLGVLMEQYKFVNIFVWYALVYVCASAVFYMILIITDLSTTDSISRILAFRVAFTIIWYCFAFYFLLIVNSYKGKLYYYRKDNNTSSFTITPQLTGLQPCIEPRTSLYLGYRRTDERILQI